MYDRSHGRAHEEGKEERSKKKVVEVVEREKEYKSCKQGTTHNKMTRKCVTIHLLGINYDDDDDDDGEDRSLTWRVNFSQISKRKRRP